MCRSKAKVMVLQQRSDGHGVQAYIRKGKKKLEPVQPGMVQAMHLATPHNYEQWIVIKGEHTGKYVRSIRYDKVENPRMPIWWTVAVVEPAEGEVDRIVREELHVDSDALCLEDKSKASKLKNMQFSRNLREEGGH